MGMEECHKRIALDAKRHPMLFVMKRETEVGSWSRGPPVPRQVPVVAGEGL